ncbi:unnamed protein product [Rotaria sp. Silwood2]|nr:unnamed protein product [Rotaria sp. Silwood2]
MSSIHKYELLKIEGTWKDRLKYVISSRDKTEIEKYLKQSSSYDDLQMLVFLSKLTKNEKNLLEISKTDSLPIRQRTIAAKGWLKIQRDEKQIYEFIVETMNDKNIARCFKNQIFENLHQIDYLKKSSAFFYNLVCRLTESCRHDQYNLDAHLVPFCSKDQILNLLSQWSIERLEQIDSSSLFRSKLIYYQPLIVIHLIQCDLNEKKKNSGTFSNYFQENDVLLSLLAKKEAKAILRLTIEYINQLEKHKRFLPNFIQSKQKYFFKKVPDEMIELITIVASDQPGTIKYQTFWDTEGSDVDAFIFPRSFSLDHYIRLFFALYDTCKWSTNHTICLLQYMLKNSNQHLGLYSSRKQRKWLFDIVINERIGKELFIEKLLKEGNETTLKLFEEYAEITTPLSLHLISQYETNKTVSVKQRLSLIRYQLMTQDIFDQLLTLFNQTSSNVHQREQNYILFLQCAFSTNDEQVKNILQWIQKQFTNERLTIIETFLHSLSEYNNRFQLKILSNNFETIEAIIEIALNHLQQSTNTLQIIINYGLLLLQRVEYHPNKERREQIQIFACKIIKRCFSTKDSLKLHIQSLSESYPRARNLIANILISDVFSKFLSKGMLDELNDSISSYLPKSWCLPQIDSFINSFFIDYLPSSTKLQTAFQIDTHNSIISVFLKKRSTQFERINQLINKIDKIFFINEIVQYIALRSQQHRQLIDKLIEDNKCVTFEKLSNEETKLATNLQSKTKNIKLPGLSINILKCSFHYLTGKQQEHITKIILQDFLQDQEVTNPKKLKALRVLHHLTHTYNESLQWFDEKQKSSLSLKSNISADVEPLDPIIICLPITFDLTPQELLKQFHFLKIKLNASNAKYISDAMLTILRRLPEEIFLKHYLELVGDEQFQQLGITANKEILRLLNEYASDSSLINSVIKPLWDSRPHPDVRACLILTLLNFIDKLHSNDEKTVVWKILEEAADDNYLPVVQSLFSAHRGTSRWPLSRLINSPDNIFQTFINRIQFKILDHPTLLEARLWAWSNIDYEHCDTQKLIEKSKQLCIQFDKDANTLWENAFSQIILSYKRQKISSSDAIVDIIKNLMACREGIDSKENAVDKQHDLPVYHRIHHILTILINHINQFDNEKKLSFRSLAPILLQFDKTFAFLIGTLLIKIAQNRDDLESMLILFQENLSENYFESVLIRLAKVISNKHSRSFIEQLNVNEKLDLAQWFIKEKDQGLFVFDLLKIHVFNRSGVDREQCQNLLRQMRQSENLFLRQQALGYTVRWKRKKERHPRRQRNQKSVPNSSSDPDISDINLFEIFDVV